MDEWIVVTVKERRVALACQNESPKMLAKLSSISTNNIVISQVFQEGNLIFFILVGIS